MSRKMALLLSTALTVFVLIVSVGLAVRLGSRVDATTSGPADQPVASATPTPDLAAQREQLYRQRLDEANAGLRQAYDQIGALQAENAALKQQQASAPRQEPRPQVEVVAQREPAAPITRDQAAAIAVQVAGGGQVREIDLEREHGAVVYEVKVGKTKVYVDATTGEAFSKSDKDDDDD